MADKQKTLVLLKPDALQRDLLGEIVSRFERKGLKFVAMKFIRLNDEMLEEHYSHLADKPFFVSLKQFMMQTPVVGMILEGYDAIAEVRKVVGSTNPREADAGTIRADLSMNVPSNLIHASDSEEAAATEIKRFFGESEIFDYEKITDRYIFGEGI
ncbi:nucleoside-diphosphate kinase [Candidatus Uhrbacteria bacterium CG_4_9_14_3_um_filter_50_9]|uniref:Nucleoside diphosphate kinase n=1 Tax=Candidatus Uhrbacteria bacterium CG_4_9_14_3_um_filter_50_9 TaxID=1975035 RepID=A0A2M7XEP7_9BACT|nr:MAG: nucleoside-diphosphate kinase [Candidatus Uhrbacteria bacterium CG_4_9_14_3_um_filter_50_9]